MLASTRRGTSFRPPLHTGSARICRRPVRERRFSPTASSLKIRMEKPAGAPTVPDGWKTITEGKATVLMKANEVFYNPVQETNRDLSIMMIKLFQELRAEDHAAAVAKAAAKGKNLPDLAGVSILEALSATGLRSIRYWKEIEGLSKILVNDIDAAAVEAIRRNIEYNQLDTKNLIPNQGDAAVVMCQHKDPLTQFDVVDLDPYGSASAFLDGAVQAVTEGGMLAVTCTDLAVLCGNHSEVCYSKYGATPLKGQHCHEMALRIVLAAIESAANRHKRHIVPMISLAIDFYVRIFVRVYTSANEVKRTPSKLALVYQCVGCGSSFLTFHLQPVGRAVEDGDSKRYLPAHGPPVGPSCAGCNNRFMLGGPMWARSIFDPAITDRVLKHLQTKGDLYKSTRRILGMVTALSEELQDCPLFQSLPTMCSTLRLTTPPIALFRNAIRAAGFRVSASHTDPTAIKTDAPPEAVWDVLRLWSKIHPAKGLPPDSVAEKILSREPKLAVDLSTLPERKELVATKAPNVARYMPNPTENWGPKPRATGKRSHDTEGKKQGKKGKGDEKDEKDEKQEKKE